MSYPNNANTYLPGTIQIPSALEITAISRSNPMVITTDADPVTQVNTYIAGQNVRLNIPFSYGMQQANGMVAQIIGVADNQIAVDIDSRLFDVFAIPTSGEQPASLSPSGSRNLTISNITNQVPFQSLNNRGN